MACGFFNFANVSYLAIVAHFETSDVRKQRKYFFFSHLKNERLNTQNGILNIHSGSEI